jgi:hypothetical protein
MKKNYTIFYSWQSDLPSSTNRNLIESCIKNAIKVIQTNNNEEIEVEVNIDRDTLNKSGSPNIADTIFEKIRKSDIFICDISLINNGLLSRFTKSRKTPNPNVLLELGYAIHLLGWDRIICVNNLRFGEVEDLPFDLRGHRISVYNSSEKDCKQKLTSILKHAIPAIINNYDSIEEKHENDKFASHDRNIFNELNKICNETTLMDGISTAVDSLFTNEYYYRTWNNLQEFYEKMQNRFLSEELHLLCKGFLKDLSQFKNLCVKKFFRNKNSNFQSRYDANGNEIQMTAEEEFDYLQSITYSPRKEPFTNESYNDADDRIYKLQDNLLELSKAVKDSYGKFVMAIKRKL